MKAKGSAPLAWANASPIRPEWVNTAILSPTWAAAMSVITDRTRLANSVAGSAPGITSHLCSASTRCAIGSFSANFLR